ncbi:hypothetical protein [Sphingomonas gellani]|nr:hypothetical protein [Sphingomonas gellani]
MDTRHALIEMMKRVLAGGEVSNSDLLTSIPDPTDLDQMERLAWQRLSQWADDDDIRARDEAYADMQRQHVTEALSDLEALDAGYDPREIELGDHQATHIRLVGCLVVAALVAAVLYAMFAHGFFMHGD